MFRGFWIGCSIEAASFVLWKMVLCVVRFVFMMCLVVMCALLVWFDRIDYLLCFGSLDLRVFCFLEFVFWFECACAVELVCAYVSSGWVLRFSLVFVLFVFVWCLWYVLWEALFVVVLMWLWLV